MTSKTPSLLKHLLTSLLRVGLVVSLLLSGWLIYSKLPHQGSVTTTSNSNTTLQIVLRPSANSETQALDIPFELYPFDIVAARHEFFADRRAGKRFDDFLNERTDGRTPVQAQLDKQGQTSVVVRPGTWWLHAQLSGDESLEWRLRLEITGNKQTVVLTPQNIYMRSRSF